MKKYVLLILLTCFAYAEESDWKYKALVDISGKSGNTDNSKIAVGFDALLERESDKFLIYFKADTEENDGATTANEYRLGVDYEYTISEMDAFYAKSEVEYDEVEQLDLRFTIAAGYGFYFYKEEKSALQLRVGVQFRSEEYADGSSDSTPALDLGLYHRKEFEKWGKIETKISYNPSFEEFENYLIDHETFWALPMAVKDLSVDIGVSNQYNSNPIAGVDSWDLSYFVRLGYSF